MHRARRETHARKLHFRIRSRRLRVLRSHSARLGRALLLLFIRLYFILSAFRPPFAPPIFDINRCDNQTLQILPSGLHFGIKRGAICQPYSRRHANKRLSPAIYNSEGEEKKSGEEQRGEAGEEGGRWRGTRRFTVAVLLIAQQSLIQAYMPKVRR